MTVSYWVVLLGYLIGLFIRMESGDSDFIFRSEVQNPFLGGFETVKMSETNLMPVIQIQAIPGASPDEIESVQDKYGLVSADKIFKYI